MGEDNVFKHGDVIKFGTIPTGFIVLEKRKWDEEQAEMTAAHKNANRWCWEYHQQGNRADKAERELEKLKQELGCERLINLQLRGELKEYRDKEFWEKRPDFFGDKEAPQPLTQEGVLDEAETERKYHVALGEVEEVLRSHALEFKQEARDLINGIHSSQARALLYYLVQKGVI